MNRLSHDESPQAPDRQNPGDNLGTLLGKLVPARDYFPTEEERHLINWLERAAELQGKSPLQLAIAIHQMAMECGRKKIPAPNQTLVGSEVVQPSDYSSGSESAGRGPSTDGETLPRPAARWSRF